ncbi:unnamed protein product, partial [Wuchereria bancrofti]
GRIVICGSATTLFPTVGSGPYSCSKFAVQAYCNIIRHELRSYGVDVIEIIPGSFDTAMQSSDRLIKMADDVWHRASQKLHDEYGHNYNEKVRKFIKKVQQNIVEHDTTLVIDSYYEAIVAKRPNLLYRVGWDVFHPYSLLPLRLQLYVMKIFMYLTGAPLPSITTENICSKSLKNRND